MLERAALPFGLRSIIDRVDVAPPAQSGRGGCGWRRMIAALEDWWTTSYLAWRREILPNNHGERFYRFCRDCGEDTPHEGSDEFGLGWYAQIYHCRCCGLQGMRVWPLA